MKKLGLLLIATIVLSGCVNKSSWVRSLPTTALRVQDKGNGWVTFEMEGKKFLYFRGTKGYAGYCAITEVTGD